MVIHIFHIIKNQQSTKKKVHSKISKKIVIKEKGLPQDVEPYALF